MHLGHRLAGRLAQVLYAPGGTGISRKQCALFGALALVCWNYLLAALVVLCHSLAETPTPEALPIRQTYAWHLGSWLAMAVPPVAAFGALGGLVRYQMKQGTSEEKMGGGGGLQALFALPSVMLLFPFVFVVLPLLVVLRAIFRKDFWGDGTTGWIPAACALVAAVAVAVASTKNLGADEIKVWAVAAVPPADYTASWVIFSWHEQKRLAAPAEPAVSARFSLNALLIAILLVGAYASLLVLVFR